MEKHPNDSYTEQVQILTQNCLNGNKRLFGGLLMQWIDIVAAVVARRHSEMNVTTAVVDTLQFEGPAYANDTILLTGKITYVGTSSMEIRVNAYVEALSGKRTLITTAYVVMVALDEDEKPTAVPRLALETDEERKEWEMAARRNSLRKKRRIEEY